MFGHPALRLLFWMKLRGGLRLQVRKLRRPSSWIFLIIGAVLVLGWIGLMAFNGGGSAQALVPGDVLRFTVDIGLVVLVTLTLVGAFQYRGLYLPKEEIELAFSAPLERTQLVRYRLGTGLFRSVFAAILFGFLTARRMPHATTCIRSPPRDDAGTSHVAHSISSGMSRCARASSMRASFSTGAPLARGGSSSVCISKTTSTPSSSRRGSRATCATSSTQYDQVSRFVAYGHRFPLCEFDLDGASILGQGVMGKRGPWPKIEVEHVGRYDFADTADKMNWPIEGDDFETMTFEYSAEELGIDPDNAAKESLNK